MGKEVDLLINYPKTKRNLEERVHLPWRPLPFGRLRQRVHLRAIGELRPKKCPERTGRRCLRPECLHQLRIPRFDR